MSVFFVVITPLLTAAILLALWTHSKAKRIVALLGSAAHLGVAVSLFSEVLMNGPVSRQLGNWPAPFGITFTADTLSAVLVLVSALIGALINVYAYENLDAKRKDFGFHPLFFVLLAGVSGAFVTADLFNLFVWFECILLSSFVLIGLGGETRQIRGALNYVVPNLFASMLFLSGLGLLYGMTGTLNMADLAVAIRSVPQPLVSAVAVLFFVAFSVKAAVFPFVSWLPSSYHTPPVAITALFAGLLTKVGVYALFRFFVTIVPLRPGPLGDVVLVLCLLTMVVPLLAACVSKDLKKILAYNIVSHIGVMVAGLALYQSLALRGAVVYMVHHMVVITALFLAAGILESYAKTTRLDRLGDTLRLAPNLAYLLLVLFLALAGIPPLSGFWPKLFLVQASLQTGHPEVAFFILLVGLLTLYSVIRAWILIAWKPRTDNSTPFSRPPTDRPAAKYLPVVLLSLAVVLLGLFPGPLAALAGRASGELMTTVESPTNNQATIPDQGGID